MKFRICSQICIIALFVYLFSGCSGKGVKVEGTTVIFHGEINSEHTKKLFSAVEGKKIERLLIDSGGGVASFGIDIGYWIYNNGIEVEVNNFCFSACANYIFPAGKKKWITNQGIVGWHGNIKLKQMTRSWVGKVRDASSSRPEELDDRLAETETHIDEIVEKENTFFEKIEVNEYICRIGNEPPYEVEDGYILSKEDMALFGITNVIVRDNYHLTDLNRFNNKKQIVEYIKIDKSLLSE